jgi:hypothetical protein
MFDFAKAKKTVRTHLVKCNWRIRITGINSLHDSLSMEIIANEFPSFFFLFLFSVLLSLSVSAILVVIGSYRYGLPRLKMRQMICS